MVRVPRLIAQSTRSSVPTAPVGPGSALIQLEKKWMSEWINEWIAPTFLQMQLLLYIFKM